MGREKKLIIGNWKMNLGVHDASLYLHRLEKLVKVHRNVEIVLAPTMLAVQTLSLQIDRRQFRLAAQNFYHRDFGAYTGEVSAAQLKGVVDYALVGHSERRHIFNEHDKDTRAKVQAAIRNDITPVLCIGETATEHSADETRDVIHDQLAAGLTNVTSEEASDIIVAYEPVWAIGTGINAKPADVTKAVLAIRSQFKHLFGSKVAEEVRILYGGSVNEDNAADYLMLPGIDGLLIGGASLDAHVFSAIIEKAHKNSKKDT
ncbi:triose-phosphate isomerase [Candidatus Saccharibacteria bacterium]|nr:triose-phosphate isomerase [Candidatus Saccharibacteria bacterium]NCS83103.1 triose-phosphate isomerase [Candidatus Saccharibacteria bacterium]